MNECSLYDVIHQIYTYIYMYMMPSLYWCAGVPVLY